MFLLLALPRLAKNNPACTNVTLSLLKEWPCILTCLERGRQCRDFAPGQISAYMCSMCAHMWRILHHVFPQGSQPRFSALVVLEFTIVSLMFLGRQCTRRRGKWIHHEDVHTVEAYWNVSLGYSDHLYRSFGMLKRGGSIRGRQGVHAFPAIVLLDSEPFLLK